MNSTAITILIIWELHNKYQNSKMHITSYRETLIT